MLSDPSNLSSAVAAQLTHAAIASRKHTGVGFYTHFAYSPDAPISRGLPSAELGDFDAQHPMLQDGAGFVLFIRDGVACFLEGYTYGEETWPDNELLFTIPKAATARAYEYLPRDHENQLPG